MRRRAGIVIVSSVLAVLLVASTPAQAVTVWRIRSIVKLPSGAPLLVGLGGLSKQTVPIRTVTEGGNPSSQQWIFERVPNATVYRIINRYSGLCMGIHAFKDNNRPVLQALCQAWDPQRWAFRKRVGSGYQLVNVYSGKCLDITGFRYAPGTALQQYSCSVGANQAFYLDRFEVP